MLSSLLARLHSLVAGAARVDPGAAQVSKTSKRKFMERRGGLETRLTDLQAHVPWRGSPRGQCRSMPRRLWACKTMRFWKVEACGSGAGPRPIAAAAAACLGYCTSSRCNTLEPNPRHVARICPRKIVKSDGVMTSGSPHTRFSTGPTNRQSHALMDLCGGAALGRGSRRCCRDAAEAQTPAPLARRSTPPRRRSGSCGALSLLTAWTMREYREASRDRS